MKQSIVLTDKTAEAGDKSEEIKITFRASKDFLRQLKHHAADNEMTVTEIIKKACKQYLNHSKK